MRDRSRRPVRAGKRRRAPCGSRRDRSRPARAPCVRRADPANARTIRDSLRASSRLLSHFAVASGPMSQLGTACCRKRLLAGRGAGDMPARGRIRGRALPSRVRVTGPARERTGGRHAREAAMLAGRRGSAYLSRGCRGLAAVLRSGSEPMFNVPPVVAATVAVLILIHFVRDLILPQSLDLAVLAWFAFIPARYDPTPLVHGAYPGGLAADVWTFVTYALLHGNWLHLGLNAVWLLAFGTPVARR